VLLDPTAVVEAPPEARGAPAQGAAGDLLLRVPLDLLMPLNHQYQQHFFL
tara:strand:- start:348 stop:497 length:150 start_codon:yes stop_codon:yes gene_type:complete